MKKRRYISNTVFMLSGALLGAVGGYIYWKQVGCLTGSCSIFSSPISYLILGGAIGALLLSIVGDFWNRGSDRKKNEDEK